MEKHNYYVIAKKGEDTLFTTNEFQTIYGLTMKVNDFFYDVMCEIHLYIYDDDKCVGYFQESFDGLIALNMNGERI